MQTSSQKWIELFRLYFNNYKIIKREEAKIKFRLEGESKEEFDRQYNSKHRARFTYRKKILK